MEIIYANKTRRFCSPIVKRNTKIWVPFLAPLVNTFYNIVTKGKATVICGGSVAVEKWVYVKLKY